MVFETIRAYFVQQMAYDEDRIMPETVVLEDLEAEPADLGELMLMLEQEFAIEWTDDDLKALVTIGDITAFVENQL